LDVGKPEGTPAKRVKGGGALTYSELLVVSLPLSVVVPMNSGSMFLVVALLLSQCSNLQ
jgi:hypothetical protein